MTRKIPVTLHTRTVADLDCLVRELDKLDRAEEGRLAEDGLGDESWPTY